MPSTLEDRLQNDETKLNLDDYALRWQGTTIPIKVFYEGQTFEGTKKVVEDAKRRQWKLAERTTDAAYETLLYYLFSLKPNPKENDPTGEKAKIRDTALDYSLKLVNRNQKIGGEDVSDIITQYFTSKSGGRTPTEMVRFLDDARAIKTANQHLGGTHNETVYQDYQASVRRFLITVQFIRHEVQMLLSGDIEEPSFRTMSVPQDPRVRQFNELAQSITRDLGIDKDGDAVFRIRETAWKNEIKATEKLEDEKGDSSKLRDVSRITAVPKYPFLEEVFVRSMEHAEKLARRSDGFFDSRWRMFHSGNFQHFIYVALPTNEELVTKYGAPRGFLGEIKIQSPRYLEADLLSHRCYEIMRRFTGRDKALDAEGLLNEYNDAVEQRKNGASIPPTRLEKAANMLVANYDFFQRTFEDGGRDAVYLRRNRNGSDIIFPNVQSAADLSTPEKIVNAYNSLFAFHQYIFAVGALKSNYGWKEFYFDTVEHKANGNGKAQNSNGKLNGSKHPESAEVEKPLEKNGKGSVTTYRGIKHMATEAMRYPGSDLEGPRNRR